MHKIISNIWTAVLWTAVIFLLLGLDSERVPEIGIFDFRFRDKFYHFLVFAIFAFLWYCYAVSHHRANNFNPALFIFILGSLYGIGMEFFQESFTNRQFSWLDGIADMVGTGCGLLIAKKSPYRNRGRNQN